MEIEIRTTALQQLEKHNLSDKIIRINANYAGG